MMARQIMNQATQVHVVSSTQHVTVVAGAQDIGFAASDTAEGTGFIPSGKDILLAQNTNVGAQTITVTLETDEYGRAGAVTTYSIGADEIAYFGILDGAYNTSSVVHIETSSDDVHLAVLALP